ncbi:MAG: YraN family protein [Anaerolineales bacterium]
MNDRRQRLGRRGEVIAAAYLQARGYTILARNLRCGRGEIDLVATRDGLLVFVEVRTRSSAAFAHPEETVTRRKQARLLAAAEAYLQEHPESPETWQFDLIAIEGHPDRQPVITHFENVFS